MPAASVAFLGLDVGSVLSSMLIVLFRIGCWQCFSDWMFLACLVGVKWVKLLALGDPVDHAVRSRGTLGAGILGTLYRSVIRKGRR